MGREEDRDCGEWRGGVICKREIVTPWETIKIIVYIYIYIYIYSYVGKERDATEKHDFFLYPSINTTSITSLLFHGIKSYVLASK